MNLNVSFGAWVRRHRKALDMTQEDLARKVSCSVSAIRKIEAGERRPSRQIAELLAGYLGIPPGEQARFLKVARAGQRVEGLPPASFVAGVLPPGDPLGENLDSSAVAAGAGLPIPPTPLIGRQPELTEMTALLQNPACRLLTLLGPGGIGKTRLALQVAVNLANSPTPLFLDGVSYVSLMAFQSLEFAIPAIADAVHFRFYGPGDPQVQLLKALQERTMLLVCDDAEHLLAGGDEQGGLPALLSEILHRAPGVKILAASRQRLNLQGEWIFEIQGLPVPPEGRDAGLEDFSAVSLFVESARRVRPRFELNEGNRAAVVRICQLTDGLPLAIELAAGWTRMLSCGEIAAEIESSLDFLSTTARDLPERHRSLRMVFENSWNLLSELEQAALRRLSVFQSGFRREAAASVAGANLRLLSALVDKSLLRRFEGGRYELHDLVRTYAAEALSEHPVEHYQTLENHCEYFMRFIQERGPRLSRDCQAAVEIRAELEDIRAAWVWALSECRLDLIARGAEGLARFYRQTGLLKEGEVAFDLAVERVRSQLEEVGGAGLERLLVELLIGQAGLFNDRAHYSQAIEAARLAIDLSRGLAETRSEAAGHLEWARALWQQSDPAGAQARALQAQDQARAANAPNLEAGSQAILGMVCLSSGQLSEALTYYEQALQTFRTTGDLHAESGMLNRLGSAYFSQGNPRQAAVYFEKALQIYREFGDRQEEGIGLNNLGVISQSLGDYYQAKGYMESGVS